MLPTSTKRQRTRPPLLWPNAHLREYDQLSEERLIRQTSHPSPSLAPSLSPFLPPSIPFPPPPAIGLVYLPPKSPSLPALPCLRPPPLPASRPPLARAWPCPFPAPPFPPPPSHRRLPSSCLTALPMQRRARSVPARQRYLHTLLENRLAAPPSLPPSPSLLPSLRPSLHFLYSILIAIFSPFFLYPPTFAHFLHSLYLSISLRNILACPELNLLFPILQIYAYNIFFDRPSTSSESSASSRFSTCSCGPSPFLTLPASKSDGDFGSGGSGPGSDSRGSGSGSFQLRRLRKFRFRLRFRNGRGGGGGGREEGAKPPERRPLGAALPH